MTWKLTPDRLIHGYLKTTSKDYLHMDDICYLCVEYHDVEAWQQKATGRTPSVVINAYLRGTIFNYSNEVDGISTIDRCVGWYDLPRKFEKRLDKDGEEKWEIRSNFDDVVDEVLQEAQADLDNFILNLRGAK